MTRRLYWILGRRVGLMPVLLDGREVGLGETLLECFRGSADSGEVLLECVETVGEMVSNSVSVPICTMED